MSYFLFTFAKRVHNVEHTRSWVQCTVCLALRMPATPCRVFMAEPRGMDGMRMAALAMVPSARNSPDLEVLYGCLCSPARVAPLRAVL